MKGKKILLTRAAGENKAFRERLEKKGALVDELPMIHFSAVQELNEIHEILNQLETIDWIVFTSVNAVRFFFEIANEHRVKFYFYPDLKIATVGEKTKLKLEQLGYRTNFVPIQYTAEVLAENMDEKIEGKRILIPRSDQASDEYLRVFEKRKAKPIPITFYKNNAVAYSKQELESRLSKKQDYLTFTSGSTFRSFYENLQTNHIKLDDEKIICIGPSTAKVVESLGFRVTAVADPHTVEGIIKAIEKVEENV